MLFLLVIADLAWVGVSPSSLFTIALHKVHVLAGPGLCFARWSRYPFFVLGLTVVARVFGFGQRLSSLVLFL